MQQTVQMYSYFIISSWRRLRADNVAEAEVNNGFLSSDNGIMAQNTTSNTHIIIDAPTMARKYDLRQEERKSGRMNASVW